MIISSLLDFTANLIIGVLDLLPASLAVNYDVISTLYNITGYGVWILGADMCLLIASSVVFWFTVRMTLGIVLFIWRLLPLT